MAIDLINYQKMKEFTGLHESASSMKNIEEQLIRILQSHNQQIQFDESGDSAICDSRKGVNRTGHARFRRAPSDCEAVKEVEVKSSPNSIELETKKTKSVGECKIGNSVNSSGSSSITGEEGTVSNGKILVSTVMTPSPRTFSSGKPPLPTSHWKRCREIEISGKPSTSRGCHCCKKRKIVVKRVTTSGSAGDCIPADEYSWKKYDQKLIPGAHFPRGYYKCNTVKGCPARKHVERNNNDPTVLILTYEGEHRHHRSHSPSLHHHPTETLNRFNNTSGVGVGVF